MGENPSAGVSGEKIWLDGKFVPWDEARVHVLTHTLHYGLGVFEGIRCYATEDGRSAIFRLKEHVRRLYDSAHINRIDVPFPKEQIEEAIRDSVLENHLSEGYVRPLVFLGEGAMGLNPADNPVRVAIVAWAWGKYLGEEGMERGIRAGVSSFSRHHVNAKMTLGKTCGDYVNSILAKRDALLDGYDEAIMLDTHGRVSEATGENIFLVRKSIIRTPPVHSVLDGITRETVMTLARENGFTVAEDEITRDELYVADEVFLTGTAAEVTPIREIDHRQVGCGQRGPVTELLQGAYFDAVSGRNPAHPDWLSYL